MRAVAAALLLLSSAIWGTYAMIEDPTPGIHTQNLPHGICPVAGNYLLPDVTDKTSYYTCCGQQVTTVRKTCRYFVYGQGLYEDLKAAAFDSRSGVCGSKETRMNPQSFRAFSAAKGSSISQTEMQKYRKAPRLANEEAEATCMSAAAAATRQSTFTNGSSMDLMAVDDGRVIEPATHGEWQFITDSKGISSTGVVAINAVLLPKSDKVLLWARLHKRGSPGSTDKYEPGVVGPDGIPEVSTVYDTNEGTYVVKKARSTPFCSGQSLMPDGQVLIAGGDGSVKEGYVDGLYGIRLFTTKGDWNEGKWTTLEKDLFAPRWYPTQTLMPDGFRVAIIGGHSQQAKKGPIRTAEVYDHRKKATFKETPLRILEKEIVGINTMYPVAYVLPYEPKNKGDVHMFMFSCAMGAIETLKPDNSWSNAVDIHNWPTPGFCGPTTMAGTATMLLLDPKDDYTAEVAMFGGFALGTGQCVCDTPTLEWSHRLRLSRADVESKRFKWSREKMPYGRNLNDAVLTPDGKVFIFNGAKTGIVANARDAALDAWMYDPKAPEGSRFTTMSAGRIYRFYHSVALLLPDASVLITGSELGECTKSCAKETPFVFQHKAERFLPPYYRSKDRPQIVSGKDDESQTAVKYGGEITVRYLGRVTGAVLMTPGAVSHQVNANQRGVILEVVRNKHAARTRSITLKMPPNNYITQPGYHMLFLMNGDKPCTKAKWIQLL